MTAVTIPAELAAEVTAHPERFRPKVPIDAPVVVLSCNSDDDDDHIGHVGRNNGSDQVVREYLKVKTGTPDGDCWALAWAPVGSAADPDSPRPNGADRVLVLAGDPGDDEGVGHVCEYADETVGGRAVIVVHQQAHELAATRWAILPPAADQADTVTPELPDMPSQTAHVEREWRVGNHLGRTLYIDNQVIGMLDTAELAAQVVEAMNGPGREITRLNLLLADRIAGVPSDELNDQVDRAEIDWVGTALRDLNAEISQLKTNLAAKEASANRWALNAAKACNQRDEAMEALLMADEEAHANLEMNWAKEPADG